MAENSNKSYSRWVGLISLIIFGVLIAWDFSAFQNRLSAILGALVIAIVFVIVTKLARIEPGWPKDK